MNVIKGKVILNDEDIKDILDAFIGLCATSAYVLLMVKTA